MAQPGDILDHPVTRERITFLETTEQTGGESIRFRLEVGPGSVLAAPHVHPWFEERFEIVSGEWRFAIAGAERSAGQGDVVIIPARHVHAWAITSDDPAVALVECRPAGRAGEYFETIFGLAQDGLVDSVAGEPQQPWLALIVAEYHADVVYPADPPLHIMLAALAPIADEATRQGLRVPYPYPYRERAAANAAAGLSA